MGFIRGENRHQITMFPEVVDDYISEDNPVRFIDEFVSGLDLDEFEISRATPKEIGRPGYDPADMLRLYIYGYLNRIRSSRSLEKEANRNLELIWLLGKLKPDHKTIARFRAENGKALRGVWKEFTILCKEMNLFGGELIGIDGSKFRAVNGKKHNYTEDKLRKLIKWAEGKIESYLKELNEADEKEGQTEQSISGVKEKIEKLRQRRQGYVEKQEKLAKTGETQISDTDPDSRLMKTQQGHNVCYNVQIAVDSKHKLIIEQEVTSEPVDLTQLADIAKGAKEMLGVDELDLVADRGYYNGDQIRQCEKAGIRAYIQKPTAAHQEGKFPKEQFVYNSERNVYVCPAGQELTQRRTEKGRRRKEYRSTACGSCGIREQCTNSKWGRVIKRIDDEEVLERMAARVAATPEKVGLRKTLVEHPFGTIKRWCGGDHFLVKGKTKVRGEMSLLALAYNLRRAMSVVGIQGMRAALIRA